LASPCIQFPSQESSQFACTSSGGRRFQLLLLDGRDSDQPINLPAGNYSSWFRTAPSLATLTGLGNGEIICVYGPVGSNVFVSATPAVVTPPVTAPATPATVITAVTETGVYCFAYSGPTTQVANFTTRFNPAIVGVNRLNLPDGKFSSWFAAAPALTTITALDNGDILCVAGPTGTSVFEVIPGVATHVAQPGETLASIAEQFHTTVEILIQLNPNVIEVGQVLVIRALLVPVS
jgi:hypothetical protein